MTEIITEYKRCVAALEEAEKDLNSDKPQNLSVLESMLSSGTSAMRMLQRHHAYGPRLQEVVGKIKEYKERKPLVAAAGVSDCLLLENICCTDADGNEFERHGQVYVPKSIDKNGDGSPINNTPYNWIVYFEQRGMSLPSFALSCNILEALWKNKDNPECMQVLMNYKDKGNGYGWHAQNTLVNWGSAQVIHYPSDADFTSNGGNNNINNGGRMPLQFSRQGFKDCTLEDALKNPGMERFVKQLTGLRNPDVLVEIGKHFGKPAYVWTSGSNDTRAAWLGCSNDNLVLFAISYLSSSSAARGVRSSS
ncbi:MAG: hypothetical protein PHO02_06300 [Candidatus Nanoarchaeia archaeon]|nr:hypothetical protein [Candidatus Nanoarchaeia archaeon]